MKKLLSLLVALVATYATWASNVITYKAASKLEETTSSYSSGLHKNAFNVSITSHTFSNGTGTINFSGEVTGIGQKAFYGCSGLTSITIPNSVTSIGDYAFDDCSGLTSITIPNSVTSIGWDAFRGCSGLTSITIPNSVTSIGWDAFRGCSGLTSITIPNSVTSIGEDAFGGCTSLPVIDNIRYADTYLVEAVDKSITSCTIKSGTKWIGNSAFRGCSGLTSITIPNSVTSIGDYAFEGCTSLPVVANVRYADTYLVEAVDKSITSCTIKSGTKWIGNGAFYACSGLTSITIPNSVTSIGSFAFNACSGLTSITIPNSVTSIGDYAFSGCSGLTSITIPNSVTSIGTDAFSGCSGLRHIYCYAVNPPRVTKSTFDGVNQHTYIHVPAGSVMDYQFAQGWSQFLHYYELSPLPDGSSPSDVSVQVTGNSAVFTWPVNPSASSYTLVIQKDGEVFCSLIFNNIGQLVGMNFAPARAANTNSGADQTAYGFSFVVNGLDEQSDYTYTMTAKDANDNVLQSYTGSFVAIQSAIESINKTSKATKSLVNGRILIRRGEHTYDLNGRTF